ncbi:hypothetical protein FHU26_003212 [Clostridium beijerinckii]|nr:hypothetical protein [Clostridium beijerinckii]
MCNMGYGGNIVAENNEDEIVADKKKKRSPY